MDRVRAQLVPYFKGRSLHEITPKRVEDYVTQRRRGRYRCGHQTRPVKDATVNRDIACLKVLFRKAREWGMLDESPATGLKTRKEIPNPPRLLEPDEIARLIEEMPDHLTALVACAVYSGLRREELFHLRWEDVKRGELNVVSRQDHPTKNRESRRIPLCEPLSEALGRHPRRLGCPYVFANPEGKAYNDVRKSHPTVRDTGQGGTPPATSRLLFSRSDERHRRQDGAALDGPQEFDDHHEVRPRLPRPRKGRDSASPVRK
ncbi:MAG: tyrosine-type recombinase/integrase [Candidatus Latescibacterota bacterium]